MAGTIQGNINQALGTLGALATFSPQLQDHAEKMAEKGKIKKEEKVLKDQIAAATSTGNALKPQVEEDINKRTLDLAKRKFELNPSEETYKEYARQIPGKPIEEDPEIIHQERMEDVSDLARRNAEYNYAYQQAYSNEMSNLAAQKQAMGRVSRQQEAKKKQRRNFMEYLKKQPVSLWGTTSGTVGDLPKEKQKQIASQYTKSQRQTMMNRMDKEAKNGKQ